MFKTNDLKNKNKNKNHNTYINRLVLNTRISTDDAPKILYVVESLGEGLRSAGYLDPPAIGSQILNLTPVDVEFSPLG